jgi:hypothetical protein
MKNGKRLTTLGMVLAILGSVAGCGSSSASFSTAEHAWVACNQRQPVGSPEDPTCKSLAVKACQAAKHEHITGPGTGVACEVAEPCHGSDCYLGPKSKTEESTTPTQEHTPEEEAAHNRSLETEQREEKDRALARKKVEEDETRVEGGTSIRKTEEKVCYESGKTSEECKGPLKETPQEERTQAENRVERRQGEEEDGERPPATPGCQTGGCVE